MKSPILGSSYVARSVNAADNRMVNLFPEIIPQGGKEPAFLSRAPGFTLFKSIGTNNSIRGMHSLYGVIYVVCGTALYSMQLPNYTPVLLSGGVPITSGGGSDMVSIADNGTQIIICTSAGNAYVYNVNTTVFTAMIVGVYPNFPGGKTVVFIDGYFLVNPLNSQRVYASALYDGLTWDPLAFASAEKFSDNTVALCASHGELWVFGTNSTEVWYNAGNPTFAFAPIQGGFSEIGCAAPYSIAKMDNTIFWVSSDDRGSGIIYKSRGYVGERVSTHAVEWQIQKQDIHNSVGYTYQQDGHSFYVFNTGVSNVNDKTTWVYDLATQSWHERTSWDPATGTYSRHWGTAQATYLNNFGVLKTLIGDYNQTGAIYVMDMNTHVDYIYSQQWIRSWRALPTDADDLKRQAHHSLQLDCETGIGLDGHAIISPEVSLRFSDDGGHTWSNYRTAGLGADGEYGTRVIWRRLGMTMKLRDRVYEVSGTDPTKIAIMGAELLLSPTNA